MRTEIIKCDNCRKKMDMDSLGSIYLTQVIKGEFYKEFEETSMKELNFCCKKCLVSFN